MQRYLTFSIFESLLFGFRDIFCPPPTLSTLPSRPCAGIQQRWNGCLKRTIPSVKGFGLLWNKRRSCHVAHPHFCYAFHFLFIYFFYRIIHRRDACLSQQYTSDWCKSGRIALRDLQHMLTCSSCKSKNGLNIVRAMSAVRFLHGIMSSPNSLQSSDSGMLKCFGLYKTEIKFWWVS